MKTQFTKDEVILLVRDELERTNKALKIPTLSNGLTDKDWEYIGVVVCALERSQRTYSEKKYNTDNLFIGSTHPVI